MPNANSDNTRLISPAIGGFFSAALDLIYPRTCAACNAELNVDEAFLCCTCADTITFVEEPVCLRCGAPLENPNQEGERCGHCPYGTLHFDKARSALDYNDDRVRNMIHAFKFEYFQHLDIHLTKYLLDIYLKHFMDDTIDAIVPVPLHKMRLREREFNQSESLARHLSKASGIGLRNDLIVRTRKTKPQTSLNPKQRLKNIQGAFSVIDKTSVKGLSILVVDDVMTTGCTINEVCRTLKQSGAKQVFALSLAKAYLQNIRNTVT